MLLPSGLAAQQRIELAGAVQRRQVVETADVNVADVNLRHGAPPGLCHHLLALRRVEVDADLLDLRDALRLEQHLGALAIGADGSAVHAYRGHGNSYFCTGRPACCQAAKPPLRLTALEKPCFLSVATAVLERLS